MEDETEKILKEQLKKLPKEVLNFIMSSSWDADTDEIASAYNLSPEDASAFKREVTLVLAGLTHPDEFKEVLELEVGINNRAILETIVKAVDEKIFAPIRPALIDFFDSEKKKIEEQLPVEIEEVAPTEEAPASPPVPAKKWVREPDVAPDNLPTAGAEETEPLFPPIPPKTPKLETIPPSEGSDTAHPFEEKMKQVFTAGQQSIEELVIEPPKAQVPEPPRIHHTDPYREPIE